MSTSSPDDPFAGIDPGRTFIMPTPGGRGTAAPAHQAGRPSPAGNPGADVAADIGPPDSGLNPLVALANPLLALVPQIRSSTRLADPAALRESIAQALREFEAQARARNIAPERVLAARYVLCTLLDEVAAGMPWGGSGQWARHSLLAMFHNETGGGEKVFQLMAKLAENVVANRDLLELIYAALCLGFEGRYGIIDGGRAQLDAVRERLAQLIRQARGSHSPALAQHWRGEKPPRRTLLTWLPLWVSGAVALLLLVAAYWALSSHLGSLSDPVFGQIQALRLSPPTPPVKIPAARPRLAQFLVNEIKAELVSVRDEVDRSVITLRGDGLFAPASASLTPEREALMKRIAEALAQVPGAVAVNGHTDNVRIHTAQFPSNWHLSEERAKTVREILLSDGVAADRVRAEGRADGEPVASNDTPANRALNRRVEITLFIPRGTATAAAEGAAP
jgi:type VI secretion system protein ImpK